MNRLQLFEKIKAKKSFLCVGLDPEMQKIPPHLLTSANPVLEFNKQLIDATHPYAVAYKPNLAFYEALGLKGWEALTQTVQHVRKNYPDLFLIADAKRGDIGNTSKMYAQAYLKEMDFDAITIAPYMGEDSVTPFLGFPGKWAILLALTSNTGADDFQFSGKPPLYQQVIKKAQFWASHDELMFVAGATRASMIAEIRELAPDNFLLVPGIGAQGGNLEEVAKYGMNSQCGLLVNSSRGIIYASNDKNFTKAAVEEAKKIAGQMDQLLDLYCKKH